MAVGAFVLSLPFATTAGATTSACGSAGVLSTSGSSNTCAYTTVGEDTFTVPAGVGAIDVVAVGGAGGAPALSPKSRADQVLGTLAVTPGETLWVDVGGVGGAGTAQKSYTVGGFNGGGNGGTGAGGLVETGGWGGGGASDVATCAVWASPFNCYEVSGHVLSYEPRLIVAAGGGGQAYTTDTNGSGGFASSSGHDGTLFLSSLPGATASAGQGGGAGGSSAGGLGGATGLAFNDSNGGCTSGVSAADGRLGNYVIGLGRGGDGASYGCSGGLQVGGGGGGGGGYYGGGGGGGGSDDGADLGAAGGGGGGSDLVPLNGPTPIATTDPPSVSITYILVGAVTYDGNSADGGSAPTDGTSPYNYGTTVTVLGAGSLTKTGYSFNGWNTAADGSGTAYSAGDTFSMPASAITLYAQWTVAAPEFVSSPVVSGTAAVGQQLSTTDGTWTNSPTSYVYQWQRCDNSGSNCVNILNVTNSQYTLVTADTGHEIRSEVLASNAAGPAASGYASSAPTSVVIHKPVVVTLPKLSGIAKVGNSLSVTTGTWKYSPTSYAYQWLRCTSLGYSCKTIVGATSSSYLLTAADVGHKLKAKVAASNGAGSVTAMSNLSAKVAS